MRDTKFQGQHSESPDEYEELWDRLCLQAAITDNLKTDPIHYHLSTLYTFQSPDLLLSDPSVSDKFCMSYIKLLKL